MSALQESPAPGHLVRQVLTFARLLRAAGMPVGTDRVMASLQALPVAGLGSRDDFRTVLGACLIDRAEHRPLFDQAFDLFWREPSALEGQALPRRPRRAGGATIFRPPPPGRRPGTSGADRPLPARPRRNRPRRRA